MTELTTITQALPKCARPGLTLPLSKSIGSQALAKHRAMVAVELEVMAKKMDRFGWESDRGSAAHDRIVKDWMEALQDYPLGEVQAACREWVRSNPRKMPNEGDILGKILAARRKHVEALPKPAPNIVPVSRPTAERAAEILREAGFAVKRMPQ